MVAEVSGESCGGPTPSGSRGVASPTCSASSCRAASTSTSSRNTAVTTERPWIDSERSASIPARPPTADSIGWVTSISTCSGARPGASVWITVCGGANSGSTSSLAWEAAQIP